MSKTISESAVKGIEDRAFEAAMRAFFKGPPGVIRTMQNVDSYPGEPDDKSDAHQQLPTTLRDERQALADAINAYVEAREAPLPDTARAVIFEMREFANQGEGAGPHRLTPWANRLDLCIRKGGGS